MFSITPSYYCFFGSSLFPLFPLNFLPSFLLPDFYVAFTDGILCCILKSCSLAKQSNGPSSQRPAANLFPALLVFSDSSFFPHSSLLRCDFICIFRTCLERTQRFLRMSVSDQRRLRHCEECYPFTTILPSTQAETVTYYYCFHSCASHSFHTLRRFEIFDKKTTSLCNRVLTPPSAQLFGTHFKPNIPKIICLTFAGLRLNLMSLFLIF